MPEAEDSSAMTGSWRPPPLEGGSSRPHVIGNVTALGYLPGLRGVCETGDTKNDKIVGAWSADSEDVSIGTDDRQTCGAGFLGLQKGKKKTY